MSVALVCVCVVDVVVVHLGSSQAQVFETMSSAGENWRKPTLAQENVHLLIVGIEPRTFLPQGCGPISYCHIEVLHSSER